MWRPTRTEFDGHVNSVLYISPAGTADSIDILVYFPDVIFLYTLVSMLRQLGSRDGTTLMCNIKKPLLHITVISGHEKIKQLHNIESSSSIKYILRQNSHTRLDEIICIYSTDGRPFQNARQNSLHLSHSVPKYSANWGYSWLTALTWNALYLSWPSASVTAFTFSSCSRSCLEMQFLAFHSHLQHPGEHEMCTETLTLVATHFGQHSAQMQSHQS